MGYPNFPLKSIKVVPALTQALTPYSIGDVVGTVMELKNVNLESGLDTILDGVTISDKGGQSVQVTCLFFHDSLIGTYTDNSAPTINAQDMYRFAGAAKVISSDHYVPVSGKSMMGNRRLGIQLPVTDTSLFLVIIADAAYTATSPTDLTVTLNFVRGN